MRRVLALAKVAQTQVGERRLGLEDLSDHLSESLAGFGREIAHTSNGKHLETL